jgi:hypothetical protein
MIVLECPVSHRNGFIMIVLEESGGLRRVDEEEISVPRTESVWVI